MGGPVENIPDIHQVELESWCHLLVSGKKLLVQVDRALVKKQFLCLKGPT